MINGSVVYVKTTEAHEDWRLGAVYAITKMSSEDDFGRRHLNIGEDDPF